MYRLINLILLLFFYSFKSLAQTPVVFSADLNNPQKILLNKKYVFINSPAGYGKTKEFALNPHRPNTLFKEERNTAWFTFDIPWDGIITFEITPHKVTDDYDWMLFPIKPGLKEEIQKDQAKPVRSNNARNDERIAGKTGLKEGFENLYESPGPGKSFSKPLPVKRGERYVIVIDNIYEGGDGFDFQTFLNYDENQTGIIEGIIRDKLTSKLLKATIAIEDDSSGTFLSQVVSNDSGKYSIKVPLKATLNVIAQHPNYLFQTAAIKTDIKQTKHDFLLDKIEEGNKLILFNIRFSPNKDDILQTSDPELARLINFLKQQPQWNIRIIGHTNNNVFASPRYLQQLSFNRALAVKKTLLKNGIPEKRISCAGMGGKYPLVDTKDPVEGLRNLRVEVVLTK